MIRNIVIALVAVGLVGGGWYASGYEDRKAQAAYERSQAARDAAEAAAERIQELASTSESEEPSSGYSYSPPSQDPTDEPPSRTYTPASDPTPEPEPEQRVAAGGVPAGTWGCWQYMDGVSLANAGYWGNLIFDGGNGYMHEGVGSGTYSMSGRNITFLSGNMTDYTGEYPDDEGRVRIHGKASAGMDLVHAMCSPE